MDQLVSDHAAAQRVTFAFWFDVLFARPADYASVRAPRPLPDPERYESLTRGDELDLIRAYHEDGDLDALDRLVGAHRPMVVRTAKNMWRGTVKLKALVEYGMLGLRIAAQPPRPSKSKKGAMVGFDPLKGSFSTYARPYAKKEMQMAVSGLMVSGAESDILPDEFEHKTTATIEEWMAPDERIDDDDILADVGHVFATIWDASLKDARAVIKSLQLDHELPEKCFRKTNLWSLGEPEPREVRGRNYLKYRITARELANKDLEYWGHYLTLATYEKLAKGGMTGWLDDDADHDPWEPATGALNPKVYRLPKAVLKHRWKLGKEQYRNIRYRFNQGLGLYDKRGRKLPVYPRLDGRVTVKKGRRNTPFLCLSSLASIYSLRRRMRQYVILLAAGLYINRRRFER